MQPAFFDTHEQQEHERLESAIARAMPFGLADDRVACESLIFAVNPDLPGKRAAARMYLQMIRSVGGPNAAPADHPRVIKWFDRAVYFRERSLEEPHRVEAIQDAEQFAALERSRVIDELGFDPHNWPADGCPPVPPNDVSPRKKRSNNMLPTILSIVALLIGFVATGVMLVMLMASGANASDVQIRQLKWLLASVVFVQSIALGGMIALLIVDRAWWAVGAGILPAAYAITLTTILVKLEW